MALHLLLVLLFQQETGFIIHVPGKFIPTLISFLHQHLPRKEHEKLVKCQHLISAKWKARQASETEDAQPSQESGPLSAVASDTSEEDSLEALIEDLKCLVVRVNP